MTDSNSNKGSGSTTCELDLDLMRGMDGADLVALIDFGADDCDVNYGVYCFVYRTGT